MQTKVIQYTTKSEAVEENRRLISNVFAALAETAPKWLRYTAFLLDDGVTFVHIVAVEDGEDPLAPLPAFQIFQQNIQDRWTEPPSVRQATLVGSYQVPR